MVVKMLELLPTRNDAPPYHSSCTHHDPACWGAGEIFGCFLSHRRTNVRWRDARVNRAHHFCLTTIKVCIMKRRKD